MFLIPTAKKYPKNVLPLLFKLRLFHKLPERTKLMKSGRIMPAPRKNSPVSLNDVRFMEDQRTKNSNHVFEIMFRIDLRKWNADRKSKV